jgi:hypothetical protein
VRAPALSRPMALASFAWEEQSWRGGGQEGVKQLHDGNGYHSGRAGTGRHAGSARWGFGPPAGSRPRPARGAGAPRAKADLLRGRPRRQVGRRHQRPPQPRAQPRGRRRRKQLPPLRPRDRHRPPPRRPPPGDRRRFPPLDEGDHSHFAFGIIGGAPSKAAPAEATALAAADPKCPPASDPGLVARRRPDRTDGCAFADEPKPRLRPLEAAP